MALSIKNSNLSGGIYSAMSRFPLKRDVMFRYNTAVSLPSQSDAMSRQLIKGMHDLDLHPGNYDWKGIVSYGGAIYSALQKIDRPLVNVSFPEVPEGLDITIEAPITWGGLIFKLGASAYFMTKGLPSGNALMFEGATELWKTGIYLSLNAARNAFSDLISKHGLDVKAWGRNLHHIKLDKLTDSVLITALCFPILYGIKEGLHANFGGNPIEPYITSATICAADSGLQYISRKLRGFGDSVAIKDTLRPVAGDLGALALSLASPALLGSGFLYLLSRKVFAESFSGYVEAKAKRSEKQAERKDALDRVLNIANYRMPEDLRYAMAAINLAYLISVKSVTKWLYKDIIDRARFRDEELYLDLIMIHKAMNDPEKISAAAEFIFPFEEQYFYREQLIRSFDRNSGIYKKICFRPFRNIA